LVTFELKHIIYFENPNEVDNEMAQESALLPESKKFSQRGFNYIYKCLICEQLGQNLHDFKKENGTYCIEAHHVEPVANKKKGNLSISNLITVCANHHRQLHCGNSKVLVNDDK
jgi:hypothetical protein